MDKRTTVVVRLSVNAPVAQMERALLSQVKAVGFESHQGAFTLSYRDE